MQERRPATPLKIYAVAAGAGLLVALLLGSWAWERSLNVWHDLFEAEASKIWQETLQKVENGDEALHGFGALYLSSLDVPPEQFQAFAREILARHPFIETAIYLPRIPAADRQRFELEQRDKGFANFAITRPAPEKRQPAKPETDFFPVLHIEPFSVENATLLGMDISAEPELRSAIDSAVANAVPVPGAGGGQGSRRSLWLIKAVYAGTEIPQSAVERGAQTNGLIAFLIDPAKLIDRSLLAEGARAQLQIVQADGNMAATVTAAQSDTAKTLTSSHEMTKKYAVDFPGYRLAMTVSKPLNWKNALFGEVGLALLAGAFATLALMISARGTVARAREQMQRASEIRQEVHTKTRALNASETRTRMIIDGAFDSVITINAGGIVTAWNRQAEVVFGWTAEEALGRDLADIIIPLRYREAHAEGLKRFLVHGSSGTMLDRLVETTALRKNGKEFPVELSISAVWIEGECTFTAFARDITERKRTQEQLSALANYDTVTELPNRALFRDRLGQALVQHERQPEYLVTLLFLDLDNFKTVNDTLGHAVGDKLLRASASRIQACLRKSDTVARLGGDEFTVILEKLRTPNDAALVAQKIIDTMAQPFSIESHEIFASVSIGATVFPHDSRDADDLLRNADTAMYQAKGQGKGRYVFFTAEMNQRISERLELETALRKALERDEFRLQYQPQIELATGRIVGMEALVRWQRPDVGLVPPLKFIPIAEETGLIVPLGDWVLRTACAQNKAWQKAGFAPLRVAVNLSSHQFRHQNLLKSIESALNETGLAPEHLELEITESVAMENAEQTIATLNDLKAMGIAISIDDFGTGYSSLSYLKRFPIDTLKVDRSFVKDIPGDTDDAAIASATIVMAHSLKLKVIAEGVETVEQLAFLQQQGCDEVQGYYFSKPVAAEDFARLLQQPGFAAPPLDGA